MWQSLLPAPAIPLPTQAVPISEGMSVRKPQAGGLRGAEIPPSHCKAQMGQGPQVLGLVLTKHSPILHVFPLCTWALSFFQPRSSAAARRASLEACRTEEAGRWHHSLGKETWRPPPLGFVPGVIPPLGSWDVPWPKRPGVSSLHHA